MLNTEETEELGAKNEEPKDPRAKRDEELTLGIRHAVWTGELQGIIYEWNYVFK